MRNSALYFFLIILLLLSLIPVETQAQTTQTITWGDESGGSDIDVTFSGNSDLTGGTRNISEGAGDDSLALDWNEAEVDGNTVGLWRMNDNAADTTVVDAAGVNDGTFYDATGNPNTNAHSVAGWLDRALDFDGGDDYIADLDSPLLGETECTICIWAYKTAHSAYQDIMNDYANLAGRRNWIMGYEQFDGTLNFFAGDGTNMDNISKNGFTQDAWHHVCGVFNGDTNELSLYIDTVSATKVTTISNLGNQDNNNTRISPAGSFTGDIDEIHILNVARNSSEIAAAARRYVQGTAIVNYNFGNPGTLNSLSWNALEIGDWEGDISQIDVYGSDDVWHQIGGVSPTSPINNINREVPANVQIRYTFDPKSDTLQSETPKLQDVTASLTITETETLSITNDSLSLGSIGTAYSQTLQATGGTPPYTFSLEGYLPPGLTLSEDGIISGTPTQDGTYTFTITVTDSRNPAQTYSKTFTIVITDTLPETAQTQTLLALLGLATIPILSFHLWYLLSGRQKRILK